MLDLGVNSVFHGNDNNLKLERMLFMFTNNTRKRVKIFKS